MVIVFHLCSLGHSDAGIVHTKTCRLLKNNMLESVLLKCMARVTFINFVAVETSEASQFGS